MSPAIDVLVCSYNEAPQIPGLLDSLRSQSSGTDVFRVIFVDNASTDGSRRIVEENSQGLNLEYVYEPRQGKSCACNTGYLHAVTPYVAHIDGDCRADPAWIENILRVIDQEDADLFGGPYYPYFTSARPRWFLDGYNASTQGDTARYLGREYLSGANMIWRRSVVDRLGLHSLEAHIVGRTIGGGEDTNLIVRARRSLENFKVYYDPEIVVYHLTRPEKMSPWHACRWWFAYGRRVPRIWDTPLMAERLALRTLLRESWTIFMQLAWSIHLRDRRRYPYWQRYVYEVVSRRFHAVGFALQSLREKFSASGHIEPEPRS